MNVLYVGRCDSLASKLVNRFVKDENNVFIISSEDFTKAEKPGLKYKLYPYESQNLGIDKVFNSVKPEIVIFAGDIFADYTWDPSEKSNIYLSQLLNILNKSVSTEVSKFIYLSSEEVYSPSAEMISEAEEKKPVTYKGILCSQGEDLLLKFHQMYMLDYVILRISLLYGFSADDKQKDLVSSVLNSFNKNREFNGNRYRILSPVHINDVIEAIFRVKDSPSCCVYNLSGSEKIDEFETAELINDISGRQYSVKEYYGEYSCYNLDTAKIKRELEWVQFYNFKEELAKCDFTQAEIKKQNKAPKKRIHTETLNFVENILMFALFAFLTVFIEQYTVFRTIDLFYFYILLIALIFGIKQSILSIVFSSIFYIYRTGVNTSSLIDVLLNIECILKIAQYIFIGSVIGYSVDSYKVKMEEKEVEYDYMLNEYKEIKDINDDNIIIKHEYERRLLNYKTSLPKLYTIISQLSVLEPAKIFSAIVNVVKDVMNTKTVSVYTLNKESEYARLIVSLNSASVFQGNSFKLGNFPKMKGILFDNEIFVSDQWSRNEPSLAAPIFHKGQCIAIIIINEMPFHSLTIYNINLFKTLAVLITSSIVKANEYEEAIRVNKYIANTNILNEKEFNNLVEIKKEEQRQGLSNFCLLKINCDDGVLETYNKICSFFRTTDFFGLDGNNQLLVALGNTQLKDAEHVIKRLEAKGNSVTVLDLLERVS